MSNWYLIAKDYETKGTYGTHVPRAIFYINRVHVKGAGGMYFHYVYG